MFDNEVKLIKANFTTRNLTGVSGTYDSDGYFNGTKYSKYYWSEGGNTWESSRLNTVNLNVAYLNALGTWKNLIANHTWYVGGHSTLNATPKIFYNSESSGITWNGKIGLMYASDYGYATSNNYWTSTFDTINIRNNNWMYIGYSEWTISRSSGSDYYSFYVYDDGRVGYGSYTSAISLGIRPCFYLTSSTTYISGSGTQSDPIRIN